jgi:diacylglycerol kinase family enzyme
MEAELQEAVLEWEHGDWKQIGRMVKIFWDFYYERIHIKVDDKEIVTPAAMVEVSNGPWTGAALNIAPDAKLNDHKLTVSIFHMRKWELLLFFWRLLGHNPARSPKINRYTGVKISITSRRKRHVHADAREFGSTPVTYQILPNALNVITGFPKAEDTSSLRPRTLLDT